MVNAGDTLAVKNTQAITRATRFLNISENILTPPIYAIRLPNPWLRVAKTTQPMLRLFFAKNLL
jgi:hypothetical protein